MGFEPATFCFAVECSNHSATRLHIVTPTQLVGGGGRGQHWREGGTDKREGGFDGNYEVGAYGLDLVHNRETERSRVTS